VGAGHCEEREPRRDPDAARDGVGEAQDRGERVGDAGDHAGGGQAAPANVVGGEERGSDSAHRRGLPGDQDRRHRHRGQSIHRRRPPCL